MGRTRDWIQGLAAGARTQRPLAFIPVLDQVAPRVEGVSYQAMCSDATAWSSAAARTAKLIGTDAVTVGWDPTLMTEACGAPVRWEADQPTARIVEALADSTCWTSPRTEVFVESVKRLCSTVRPDGAVVVALTGPATLARLVFGDEEATPESLDRLKPFAVRLAEAVCQSRPDILVLMESGSSANLAVSPRLRRAYATLRNIASYYEAVSALHLDDYGSLSAACEQWAAVETELLFVGKSARGEIPAPHQVITAGRAWRGVGVPVSANGASEVQEIVAQTAQLMAGGEAPSVFCTTAGPVSPDADVAVLRGIGQVFCH